MSLLTIRWTIVIIVTAAFAPIPLAAQQLAQGQSASDKYQDATRNASNLAQESLRSINSSYRGMHPYFNETAPVLVGAIIAVLICGAVVDFLQRRPGPNAIAEELQRRTQPTGTPATAPGELVDDAPLLPPDLANKIVELIRERERRNLLRTVVGAVAVNVIATMIAAIIMDHLRMK